MALNRYFQWGWKKGEEAHEELDEVTQDGTGHSDAQGAPSSQLRNLSLLKSEQLFRRILQQSSGHLPMNKEPSKCL